MTDEIAQFEDDLIEFFQNRQGLSPETKHGAWHSYQLWRIANAIEALYAGIQEDIENEEAERRKMPWERKDEDE